MTGRRGPQPLYPLPPGPRTAQGRSAPHPPGTLACHEPAPGAHWHVHTGRADWQSGVPGLPEPGVGVGTQRSFLSAAGGPTCLLASHCGLVPAAWAPIRGRPAVASSRCDGCTGCPHAESGCQWQRLHLSGPVPLCKCPGEAPTRWRVGTPGAAEPCWTETGVAAVPNVRTAAGLFPLKWWFTSCEFHPVKRPRGVRNSSLIKQRLNKS